MNNQRTAARCLIVLCLMVLLMPVWGSSQPPQRTFQRRNQPAMPAQPQPTKPAIINIRVEGNRVTADISDAPLQDVLQEFADRTGIIFEIRTHDNPFVSVHLSRVTLEEAIQRIISDSDTLIICDRKNSERITMVRVFARGTPQVQPGIIYLGTGVVMKTNVDVDTPEQALKALAESTNLESRVKAVEVLVNNKGDESAKTLMNAINDPAPEVRIAVIEGLASLGTPEALPIILKKLKDPNPGVRQSATTAVALLGDARNLRDLKPLSTDKDPSVAAAAEIAIRKLSAAAKK